MGSKRLPGKVLKKIEDDTTILDSVINQLKFSSLTKNIVVATTTLNEDDVIEEYLHKIGIDCFRGNSKNVLDRYYQCAKKYSFTSIMRITADCPLIDPELVDEAITIFDRKKCDYISNAFSRTFPYGTEIEIFSFKSLEIAWKNAKKPSEKEHVTPYIKSHPELFNIENIQNNRNISNLRWTVDRKEDLELVRQIMLKINKRPVLMEDILELMKNEPRLREINNKIIPDEGMKKSLKEDDIFLKKE